MTFWDRFILRIWQSFAEVVPAGNDAALRLFALAHRVRLFDVRALADRSIVTLVMACPLGTAIRAKAETEFKRLGLDTLGGRKRLADLVDDLTPRRSTELLSLYSNGTPEQKGASADIILRRFGEPLALFLGRLYLMAPEQQNAWAVPTVVRAFARFGRIPAGTIDWECHLYRRLVGRLPPDAPPTELPAAPEPWMTGLSADERRFLIVCGERLTTSERIALYLCLYAGLNVRQVACVRSHRERWTDDEVIAEMTRSWEAVLHHFRPRNFNGA
jgi:hypothetical protein